MMRELNGLKIELGRSCCHTKLKLSSVFPLVIADQLILWFGKEQRMKVTQQNLPTVCLMKPRICLKQGQSNPTAHNGFWKKIWSINVPNKIKHFLWRAWREALPTKKNLCHRKVTHNSTLSFAMGRRKTLSMFFGSVRWLRRFGGRLNHVVVICQPDLLA